jgi:hypothetical protein
MADKFRNTPTNITLNTFDARGAQGRSSFINVTKAWPNGNPDDDYDETYYIEDHPTLETLHAILATIQVMMTNYIRTHKP